MVEKLAMTIISASCWTGIPLSFVVCRGVAMDGLKYRYSVLEIHILSRLHLGVP